MYEIIEKNQYGVKVKNTTDISVCEICKHRYLPLEHSVCKKCYRDSYYLPDSEVERLESENNVMNTTIDDLYIESKCYFEVKEKLDDTQKELIDLQNENKQLKERVNELEGTIENMKAIAGENIQSIGSITSVDYPNDNETHVTKVFDEIIQIEYAFCSKCYEQLNNVLNNENYCPNCGRKIKN